MNKFVLALCLINIAGCASKSDLKEKQKASEKQSAIFPVTEYIKGQIRAVEQEPITLLHISGDQNAPDSAWINRDSLRSFAQSLLVPVIDSSSLSAYFKTSSFLDETIHALTLTYDANEQLPDSINLRQIIVYINPEENSVSRVYLVKENRRGTEIVTQQLTWKSDAYCSKRIITQRAGSEPEVSEERLVWKF